MANPNQQIMPNMDMIRSLHDAGGEMIRAPVWPGMVRQSKRGDAFSVVRIYSATLASTDTDNALNTPATRPVRFDLPCTIFAVTGSVLISDGSGFPTGMNPLDSFSIILALSSGERITVDSRKAGGIVGTAQRPGFLCGGGWPITGGATVQLTITPVLPGLPAGAKLDIDINLWAVETRFGSSYVTLGTSPG